MHGDSIPSISDTYAPALHIMEQPRADRYFDACVRHRMEQSGVDRSQAERIERTNIGYYAGYADHATRERVERLFKTEHPYLGRAAETGPIPPALALRLGQLQGTIWRLENELREARGQTDDLQWTRMLSDDDAYIVWVALRTMLDEDWGPSGHPALFELVGTAKQERAQLLRDVLHARGDTPGKGAP